MTLEEAIKHAEEVVEQQMQRIDNLSDIPRFGSSDEDIKLIEKCEKCTEEHRQLAEWLKELRKYREILTELDAAIECYENCESCQGFREYPTSQFIKDIIRIIRR